MGQDVSRLTKENTSPNHQIPSTNDAREGRGVRASRGGIRCKHDLNPT